METAQPAASSQQPAASSQQLFARTVAIVLGLILVGAASLKLYGKSVSPLPSVGWLSLPSVQLAVVAAELIFGSCLIFDIARPLTWLAALGMFSIFAVVSGYLGYIGQASCGCFGTIKASPWAAFGVDVAAVVALLFTIPKRESWRAGDVSPLILRGASLLGGTAAILSLLALGSTLTFGSVSAGLAKLRGESLGAPNYVDFGSAKPGDKLEQQIEVRNWSDQPVRLIGGTSDCSCVTTSTMPLTIPAGEFISVAIHLKVPSSDAGAFTRTAEIWTDCDKHRTIKLRLGCRVE
jgi:hypothetical protein